MDEFRLEIIKTWFGRAEKYITGLVDGLSKQPSAPQLFYADGLIFCSIAYEAYLFGKFERLTVTKNRKELSKTFGYILQSVKLPDDLKNAINELYEESNKKHIEDMSKLRGPVRIRDKNDLDNVLEVIYRVRSNLFHGGKELSNLRNFRLVKFGFIALYRIMEIILEREGILKDSR